MRIASQQRRSIQTMFASCIVVLLASVAASDEPQFNRDIRPLLAKHCFACHGRDEAGRKADLRLDVREQAVESRAIVPKQPDASELVARIMSKDGDLRMPPAENGPPLAPGEIARLRDWIAAGATYERHWSFQPPVKADPPTAPTAKRTHWANQPWDRFVLARLEAAGLEPAPDADRARWLRRVSLDLTGLPPTVADADAFIADTSDDAYQRVVDRLLDSPAYGEHWARMWLDLARYADTKGYEKDRHRDIWRYRDWVIDALNSDMPYDQFTREQLAGDLLSGRTDDQILATAFHRNTMTNEEGGTDNEEFRVAAVKDRVDTTIAVWMGLTMGCAKCHSHKYDPIELRDYYSLYAYFNQTQDADAETPLWPTPTQSLKRQIDEQRASVSRYKEQSERRDASFAKAFAAWKSELELSDSGLWEPLPLDAFVSQHQVMLQQDEQQRLIAGGSQPEKDTWTLTFRLPPGDPVTAIRIETFPQAEAGGEWPDANVAIREITARHKAEGGQARPLTLRNARATFSQTNWGVAQAIDGKNEAGWAISPQFTKPQAAVFELAKPLSLSDVSKTDRLQLELEQEYGDKLLLARSRISVSRHPVAWLKAGLKPDLKDVFAREVHEESMQRFRDYDAAKAKLAKLEAGIPQTPVMLELQANKQRVTKIHNRGNFLDQGEKVTAGVLTIFGAMPDDAPANRLGVAQWLAQPQNPLTARVMVNRVWARLFGVGLVATEEDFGTQGAMPSHPQLLDWLAVDFREQGWSLKRLLKSLVLSRTYRQSSSVSHLSSEQLQLDPQNRLLSRGPRFRLSAEMVRDQALAASGLLTRKTGGPSVMPPQPSGIWKSTYNGQSWVNAVGPERYRRALYTYLKRTSPYPALTTFDAGSGEVCQIRRVRTNTPLQALVTLNDVAFVEAAGALASRMVAVDGSLEGQLEHGFRQVLIRKPEPRELRRLAELYHAVKPELGEQLVASAGQEHGDPAMIAVANVLLNLDETLMKP